MVRLPNGRLVWRGVVHRAMGMGLRSDAPEEESLLEDPVAMKWMNHMLALREGRVPPETDEQRAERMRQKADLLGCEFDHIGRLVPKRRP